MLLSGARSCAKQVVDQVKTEAVPLNAGILVMKAVMMSKGFRCWAPVAVYAGLIFYLSSRSHPDEELPSLLLLAGDKLLHGFEYAVLGALCYRAFRWGTNDRWAPRAVWCAVLAASLYGITDEVHQAFVPFRESSWLDWLADTAGAVLGATITHRFWTAQQRRALLSLHRRA